MEINWREMYQRLHYDSIEIIYEIYNVYKGKKTACTK